MEFLDDINYMYGDYVVNYDWAVYNEMGNEDAANAALDALYKLGNNREDFLAHPEYYEKEINLFGKRLEGFLL